MDHPLTADLTAPDPASNVPRMSGPDSLAHVEQRRADLGSSQATPSADAEVSATQPDAAPTKPAQPSVSDQLYDVWKQVWGREADPQLGLTDNLIAYRRSVQRASSPYHAAIKGMIEDMAPDGDLMHKEGPGMGQPLGGALNPKFPLLDPSKLGPVTPAQAKMLGMDYVRHLTSEDEPSAPERGGLGFEQPITAMAGIVNLALGLPEHANMEDWRGFLSGMTEDEQIAYLKSKGLSDNMTAVLMSFIGLFGVLVFDPINWFTGGAGEVRQLNRLIKKFIFTPEVENRMVADAMAQIAKTGGATASPLGITYKAGFSTSYGDEVKIPLEQFTEQHLRTFIESRRSMFETGHFNLGVWEKDGFKVLDTSAVMPTLTQAKRFGPGQHAAHDMRTGKDVFFPDDIANAEKPSSELAMATLLSTKGRISELAATSGSIVLDGGNFTDAFKAMREADPHVPRGEALKIWKDSKVFVDTLKERLQPVVHSIDIGKNLSEIYRIGKDGKDWYAGVAAYLKHAFIDDADTFTRFFAAMSANTKAYQSLKQIEEGTYGNTNIENAARAYLAWKTGDDVVLNKFKAQYSGLQRAIDGIGNNGKFGGHKVWNFYLALSGSNQAVVLDSHMFKAFGFNPDRKTFGYLFNNDSAYAILENFVRKEAAKMGVSPAEYQAGVWFGSKLLQGDKLKSDVFSYLQGRGIGKDEISANLKDMMEQAFTNPMKPITGYIGGKSVIDRPFAKPLGEGVAPEFQMGKRGGPELRAELEQRANLGFAAVANQPDSTTAMTTVTGRPYERPTTFTPADDAMARLYDAAPVMDKEAVPAWNALKSDTERLYEDIIKKVKVERVTGQPYASAAEMNADIERGVFKVTTDNSTHPVWSTEDNFKFRVVHDYLGHFETKLDFSLEGERAAYQKHAQLLSSEEAQQALLVEVYGQAAAALGHGGEFQTQKIFLPKNATRVAKTEELSRETRSLLDLLGDERGSFRLSDKQVPTESLLDDSPDTYLHYVLDGDKKISELIIKEKEGHISIEWLGSGRGIKSRPGVLNRAGLTAVVKGLKAQYPGLKELQFEHVTGWSGDNKDGPFHFVVDVSSEDRRNWKVTQKQTNDERYADSSIPADTVQYDRWREEHPDGTREQYLAAFEERAVQYRVDRQQYQSYRKEVDPDISFEDFQKVGRGPSPEGEAPAAPARSMERRVEGQPANPPAFGHASYKNLDEARTAHLEDVMDMKDVWENLDESGQANVFLLRTISQAAVGFLSGAVLGDEENALRNGLIGMGLGMSVLHPALLKATVEAWRGVKMAKMSPEERAHYIQLSQQASKTSKLDPADLVMRMRARMEEMQVSDVVHEGQDPMAPYVQHADDAVRAEAIAGITSGKYSKGWIKDIAPNVPLNDVEADALSMIMTEEFSKIQSLVREAHDTMNPDLLNNALERLVDYGLNLEPSRLSAISASARQMRRLGIVIPNDPTSPGVLHEYLTQASLAVRNLRASVPPEQIAEMIHFSPSPEHLATFSKNVVRPGFGAVAHQLWLQMLLGPLTHIANTVGNTGAIGYELAARAFAGRLGHEVRVGEATEMVNGYGEVWGEMLRTNLPNAHLGLIDTFTDVLKIGGRLIESQKGAKTIDFKGFERPNVLNMESLKQLKLVGPLLEKLGPYGYVVDYLGAVINSMGGGSLAAVDNIFGAAAQRAQVRALSLRHAEAEIDALKLDPVAAEKTYAKYFNQYYSHPPQSVIEDAQQFREWMTFTGALKGEHESALATMRNTSLGKWIVPFLGAIMKLGQFEAHFTPLPAMQMGSLWFPKYREAILQGGPEAEVAHARMLVGTTGLAFAASLWASGYLTGSGPSNPEDKKRMLDAKWASHAFNVSAMKRRITFDDSAPYGEWKEGDTLVPLDRYQPLGFLLGAGASIAEASREGMDTTAAIFHSAGSLLEMQGQQPFMIGMMNVANAVNDPDRYFESSAKRYIPSLMPILSAQTLGIVTKAIDPQVKDVQTVLDGMLAKTPWASKGVNPVTDIYGEPVPTSRFSTTWKHDKATLALVENQAHVGQPSPYWSGLDIRDRDRFGNVYFEYKQLAGHGEVGFGQTLHEALTELVSSEDFKTNTADERNAEIKALFRAYRDSAKAMILEDPKYAALAAAVTLAEESSRKRYSPFNPAQQNIGVQ